eukprot:c25632_g1_i1 orf=182-571(+)
METTKAVLLTSAASFPSQTQLQETVPSLLISSPSSYVNPALQFKLNSELQESFPGKKQRNHDKGGQLSFRVPDDEEPVSKVKELQNQQEWDEALLTLDNQLQQGGSVSAGDLAPLLQHCGDTQSLAKGH